MKDLKELVKLTETLLNETPMPEYIHKRRKYYHGTSSEQAALSIMKEGIKVQYYDKGKGVNLIPVSGRNYITADLHYAIIYALGGVCLGTNPPPSVNEENRYGYVFIIKGNQLGDIQPDEDVIGETIMKVFSWGTSYDPGTLKRSLKYVASKNRKKFIKNVFNDMNLRTMLKLYAMKHLTDKQLSKLKDGEYDMFAHTGKKLVKLLPEKTLLTLITHGAHIANDSVLQPFEAWKIDKFRCKELKENGSNFFQIAEKVNF